MKYRPRISSRRWLEGAPDYVLACYDTGPKWPHDRYLVLFGGRLWEPGMGRTVMCLFMSESGSIVISGELPAHNRPGGRKMKWADLSDACKRAVIQWAREDVCLYSCDICGGLHPWEFDGDCRDDADRYSDEEDYLRRNKLKCEEVEFDIRTMAERIRADLRRGVYG